MGIAKASLRKHEPRAGVVCSDHNVNTNNQSENQGINEYGSCETTGRLF